MKITRRQLRRLIKEEMGDETKGVVKYTVPWTYDSSPPTITLPSGEQIDFSKVVKDLVGKELVDPDDGGSFTFSLDNFRESDEDTEEDIIENMIDVGVSEFYIQQWAELVGGYSGSEDITDR